MSADMLTAMYTTIATLGVAVVVLTSAHWFARILRRF